MPNEHITPHCDLAVIVCCSLGVSNKRSHRSLDDRVSDYPWWRAGILFQASTSHTPVTFRLNSARRVLVWSSCCSFQVVCNGLDGSSEASLNAANYPWLLGRDRPQVHKRGMCVHGRTGNAQERRRNRILCKNDFQGEGEAPGCPTGFISAWESLSADEEPASQNDSYGLYSIHTPPVSSPFRTGRQLR
jgi:hypothetical protein